MNDVFSFTVIFLRLCIHTMDTGVVEIRKFPLPKTFSLSENQTFLLPLPVKLWTHFSMSWNLVYLPDKKVRKNIIEIWYQYLGIVREKTLRRNKFLLLVALIQHFHTIFHKLNCSNLWASYEASKLWKMSPYLFSTRSMTTWCCCL